ncbi:MAG: hypothetical protein QOK48_3547 [Blastocatellia bacterium]|jgi:hypothetical protein|nr:hypothetical protein [Blastocatellia bacterium]
MKALVLVLLVVLTASVTAVQDPTTSRNPPDIKVLSNNWHREVRNPALLEDPTLINESRSPADRAQKSSIPNPNGQIPVNRLLIPTSPKGPTTQTHDPHGPSVQNIYEIKILNSGEQAISRLTWDFDLIEPDTGREVGHHTFTSRKTIRTGQTAKLSQRSTLIPVSLIDASKADHNSMRQFTVRVTIRRIEYEHGPAWVGAER